MKMTNSVPKAKAGKLKTYPSAAAAVKAAEKRGEKSITVKFLQPKKAKK
jgi:hypothetical protein